MLWKVPERPRSCKQFRKWEVSLRAHLNEKLNQASPCWSIYHRHPWVESKISYTDRLAPTQRICLLFELNFHCTKRCWRECHSPSLLSVLRLRVTQHFPVGDSRGQPTAHLPSTLFHRLCWLNFHVFILLTTRLTWDGWLEGWAIDLGSWRIRTSCFVQPGLQAPVTCPLRGPWWVTGWAPWSSPPTMRAVRVPLRRQSAIPRGQVPHRHQHTVLHNHFNTRTTQVGRED